MRFLEPLFASRAARIGIVLVWLVFGGLGGSFAQRFQNIQKNEESSFLPGSSESVKELTAAKRFPSGERFTAVTVVRRDGGLTPGDRAAIRGVSASLAAVLPVTASRAVLAQLSPNGKKFANLGTGFDMTCAPSGNTFSTSDGWSGLKIGPHGAVKATFTFSPNQSLLGGTDTLTGHYDSKHQIFKGTWELHLNYSLNGQLDQCDSDPVTFKLVQ